MYKPKKKRLEDTNYKKKEKKKTVKDKEAENIIERLRIEIRSSVSSRAWASGTVQVQNGC